MFQRVAASRTAGSRVELPWLESIASDDAKTRAIAGLTKPRSWVLLLPQPWIR